MRKYSLLFIVLFLSGCTTQNIVYEEVKHIILYDGREFFVHQGAGEPFALSKDSVSFGNQVITIYSDSDYYVEHEGNDFTASEIADLLNFDFERLDMFEIEYESQHFLIYENGSDYKVTIKSSHTFLEYNEVWSYTTYNGDLVSYEELVIEPFYDFYEMPLDDTVLLRSEYFEDNGWFYETSLSGTLTGHPLMKRLVINKDTSQEEIYYGNGMLRQDKVDYRVLESMEVGLIIKESSFEYQKYMN